MSEHYEVEFSVRALHADDPAEAQTKARAVAETLMRSLPGGGEEFRLTSVETEPAEEVRWEVYSSMNGKKVLQGADTWNCRVTYLAEVAWE